MHADVSKFQIPIQTYFKYCPQCEREKVKKKFKKLTMEVGGCGGYEEKMG
jgi:hypothetical protein